VQPRHLCALACTGRLKGAPAPRAVPTLPTRQTSRRLLARDRSLARHSLPCMHEARASASVRSFRPAPTMCSLVLAGAIVVLVLISSSASAAETIPPIRQGQAGSRGSPDTLDACGAEYYVGTKREQVCRFAAHACP
jgi:hypothetical protein